MSGPGSSPGGAGRLPARADGPLVNAGRLRLKECDRLAAIPEELNKLGGQLTEGADFLEIRGVERLLGGVADSHNDHRIAMMLAVAATRRKGQ